MLDKTHNVLFLESPRTGTTSITASMSKHLGGFNQHIYGRHLSLDFYRYHLGGEAFSKLRIFIVVRHPIEQLLSWHQFIVTKMMEHQMGSEPNEKFLARASQGQSQFRSRCPEKLIGAGPRAEDVRILRFENLEEEWDNMVEEWALPYPGLKHHNSSSGKLEFEKLNPALIAALLRDFLLSMERWRYKVKISDNEFKREISEQIITGTCRGCSAAKRRRILQLIES